MLRSLDVDYALIGGGLQNALTALALFHLRPGVRIALVEREATLGGNHVWCFHSGDVPEQLGDVVAPLVVQRWQAYDVYFPNVERRVDQPYSALTSARLDAVLRARFGAAPQSSLITGVSVRASSNREVWLADGRSISARVVIRATGPGSEPLLGKAGYQKFLGLELELEHPRAPSRPTLMDARVPQLDGFRFVYVLPFSPNHVLIEDTYFSESAELDAAALRERVLQYARANGLEPRRVVREETGVLPLPLRAQGATEPDPSGPFLGGYGGGWFHPTTGYSFPAAARVAELVASAPVDELAPAWASLARAHRRQFAFFSLLNRLMFGAFAPERRYGAIEHFYRLPEAVLSRFYAMALTPSDRARIFCDRPPRGFSLRLALGARSAA